MSAPASFRLLCLVLPTLWAVSLEGEDAHWSSIFNSLRGHSGLLNSTSSDGTVWWRVSLQPLHEGENSDEERKHFLCKPWFALSLRASFTRLAHEASLPVEGSSGNCTLQIHFAHPAAATEVLQAWVLCGKGHADSENSDQHWGVTLQPLDAAGLPQGSAAQWTDSARRKAVASANCQVNELSSALGPEGLRRPPHSMQDSMRLPLAIETTQAFPTDAVLEIAEIRDLRMVQTDGRPPGLQRLELQAGTVGGRPGWSLLQQPGRRACVDTTIAMVLLDLGVPQPLPSMISHLRDTISSFQEAVGKHADVRIVKLGSGAKALEVLEAHLQASAPKSVTCALPLDLPSLGGHAVLVDGGTQSQAPQLWLREPYHGIRLRVSPEVLAAALGLDSEAACVDVHSRLKHDGSSVEL